MVQSYLAGRSQYVTYGDTHSDTNLIRCGVPHGSILGPLLFIIYINKIYNVSQLLLTIVYAYNRNVLLTGSDLNKLVESLNRESSLLSTWVKANKLSLNIQKTYFVIFHRAIIKLQENPQTVLFNKITLSKTNCIKYRGVILDSKIVWIQHIDPHYV